MAAVCAPGLFAAEAEDKAATTKHVIHVSVDGLNAGLLAELIERDTTGRYVNFKRLIAEGVSTFNARTDFTQTFTLPNHTSILTGRPVDRPEGWDETRHHGYTENADPMPGRSLHNQGNAMAGYIAGVFDVAHDRGLSTALFAGKSKFVVYTQSYDAQHGAPDAVAPDHGRNKVDFEHIEQTAEPDRSISSRGMHKQLLTELAQRRFNYTFVHYREPDSAGHGYGWGGERWNGAVHVVDGYLGDILKLVESDASLRGRTTIILTSDHGGEVGLKSHLMSDHPDNYTIAFIVWGAGVAKGADLYQLNAGARHDPGTDRPDYTAEQQPIRNGDSGNLALHLLNLPPIPGSSINAKQDLRVGP